MDADPELLRFQMEKSDGLIIAGAVLSLIKWYDKFVVLPVELYQNRHLIWKLAKNDFKSNQEFWIPKIERNIKRDTEVNETLSKQGWTVLRFWGKDVEKHLDECVERIMEAIGHHENA